MNAQKLLESTDATATARIAAVLPAEEEVLIRASTDLAADGRFGRQWLVATEHRVLVVPTQGEIVDIPLAALAEVRTDAIVGGGQLEIERVDAPTLSLSYTSSEAEKMSEVARGLEQLRQGQPFAINGHLDRTRCERCDRLLPEKNGICPACIKKLATLKRIASYLGPYKLKAGVLAFASIATTAAELAPPLITKRIVDEVLVPVEGQATGFDERIHLLGLFVVALVGVRFSAWVAEWAHGWIATWLGAQLTADIRSNLYRRLEMLSLQFYDKRKVGSLISRATRDAGMLQDFLVDGLPYIVINGLMVFGILGFLFWMSWSLSLYVLIPVPLIMLWG